jgi:hypothetical protein
VPARVPARTLRSSELIRWRACGAVSVRADIRDLEPLELILTDRSVI